MHGVYERSVSSHSSRAYGEMKDWLRSGRGVHKTNTLLVWPGGTRALVSEAVPTPQASCPQCSPELRNASNSFGGLSPSAAGRLLIDISHCSLEELLRELLMPQAVMDSFPCIERSMRRWHFSHLHMRTPLWQSLEKVPEGLPFPHQNYSPLSPSFYQCILTYFSAILKIILEISTYTHGENQIKRSS